MLVKVSKGFQQSEEVFFWSLKAGFDSLENPFYIW